MLKLNKLFDPFVPNAPFLYLKTDKSFRYHCCPKILTVNFGNTRHHLFLLLTLLGYLKIKLALPTITSIFVISDRYILQKCLPSLNSEYYFLVWRNEVGQFCTIWYGDGAFIKSLKIYAEGLKGWVDGGVGIFCKTRIIPT